MKFHVISNNPTGSREIPRNRQKIPRNFLVRPRNGEEIPRNILLSPQIRQEIPRNFSTMPRIRQPVPRNFLMSPQPRQIIPRNFLMTPRLHRMNPRIRGVVGRGWLRNSWGLARVGRAECSLMRNGVLWPQEEGQAAGRDGPPKAGRADAWPGWFLGAAKSLAARTGGWERESVLADVPAFHECLEGQDGLGMNLADAGFGQAEGFGDFAQAQVLVIVEGEDFLLGAG